MAKQGGNSPSSIGEPTATFSAISSSIPQVLRQALGHYKARRSWEKLDLTGDLARTRNIRHLKYLALLAICMLELAAATVTPLYARMATTDITRMLALPTATTVLTGSSAESLSAPARGITTS